MSDSPLNPLANVAGVLDALPCGVLVINRAGGILYVNPRLCEMMQREIADVLGRQLPAFYAPGAGREVLEANLAGFEDDRDLEFHLPLPNGRQLPVLVASRRLRGVDAVPDCRIITLLDISQQKAAEESVREQYAEITRLSDTVLEQAMDLKHYSERLEERVRQRTRELHDANLDAITMLAVASEARDTDTGAHVLRIRDYSIAMARALGLPDHEADRIGQSAILHDVGKLHTPDDILKKPGALTREERARMQDHTIVGERILSERPFFHIARQIARSHHENWDGTGYPDGLQGDAIPLPARIVHLVDVYDALSNRRAYKPPWRRQRVLDAIQEGRGTHYDPRLVDTFLGLVHAGLWPAPPDADSPAVAT